MILRRVMLLMIVTLHVMVGRCFSTATSTATGSYSYNYIVVVVVVNIFQA